MGRYRCQKVYAKRDEQMAILVQREILFVSCEGLTKNEQLMKDMQDMLSLIQEHYEYPVDTEYTINLSQDGSYVVDLLQCRPLQLTQDGDKVDFPEETVEEKKLLETKGVSMGFSRKIPVDVVVYIDPIRYYNMPYRQKYDIKKQLSDVNWHYRGKGKKLLLLTPGRICTSSPELGVPSAFADISEFSVIAEVSETKAGYIPELSYGSHIFQDLVEAGILYTAVFEGNHTIAYHPELLENDPGRIRDITEEITKPAEDHRRSGDSTSTWPTGILSWPLHLRGGSNHLYDLRRRSTGISLNLFMIIIV